MIIPFPTRIPIFFSVLFAMLLCGLQLLEGTSLNFSLLSFAFILIATIAFNVAGGFSRASGSYIFFYAALAVIVGLTYKAYLGEPADSHLASPQTTMLVYVGGISGMLAAAYLKKRLLPSVGLLDRVTMRIDMGATSIGCFVITAALVVVNALATVPEAGEGADVAHSGTVLSAVNQLNNFMPLGIILGVIYTIKRSGGTKFLSTSVALATVGSIVVFGIINDSKQGIFLPILCVLVAAASMRYRFSVAQLTGFVFLVLFAFYYLVPFIQLGKGVYVGSSFREKLESTYDRLLDLGSAPEEAEQSSQQVYESDEYFIHYFDSPQGFFDRLQMIAFDDALVDITDQGSVFGLSPLLIDVYNLVPHFLWPGKPVVRLGNIYWHEINEGHYSSFAEDDETTGISFSPSADAFHMAKWTGLLVVAPPMWFACFFVIDYVGGDTRRSPWGLLFIALCSHLAPEGMMWGPFYLISQGTLAVLFIAFLATYILPLIGGFFRARKPAAPRTIRGVSVRPGR